jgi:hypothetical protein
MFFDVLCINCYECVKYTEVDLHSDYCIMQPEENYYELYNKQQDDDYNAKLYKLHESLKKKNEEIVKTKEKEIIEVYEELLRLTYEILINNNSIEELDKSITRLNEIINNSNRLCKSNYKFSLLVYGKRISQLTFTKLQDMEKILTYVKNSNNKSMSEDMDLDNYDIPNIQTDEKPYECLKMELENIERQTIKSKLELEQWKQEAKALENMLRRPNQYNEMLSDIVSDVMSRRDESVRLFKIIYISLMV